ncbi:UPK3B protein, partial [Jacana jacana]|nr:UPK3B protein [Jacana jacana]
ALLPYVPQVPPTALLGKVTATTFALEMPCCVFDRETNASDVVWLVVAFANASDTFRNPPSQSDVPLYEGLPTAHSYMTLETVATAYSCSAPNTAVLRVGDDTACGGQGGQDPCNGPLPSPGPYRVKFLVMGCHGPKAETLWSDPILLQRATSLTTINPAPTHRGSDVVVITCILASLGAALALAVLGAVGYGGCRDMLRGRVGMHQSYRTHHIPPVLPQPLPPGCRCSPPGLGCFVPRPPGPCPGK